MLIYRLSIVTGPWPASVSRVSRFDSGPSGAATWPGVDPRRWRPIGGRLVAGPLQAPAEIPSERCDQPVRPIAVRL
jgi:hypothetical protein